MTFHDLDQLVRDCKKKDDARGRNEYRAGVKVHRPDATVVAIGVTVVAAWLWVRKGERITGELVEAGASTLLLAEAHLATLLSVERDPFYPILFNMPFALSAMRLMASRLTRDDMGRVNPSLALIALCAISRYFEYSNRSLLFFGAGVILLAGGYLLDRGQRRMLAALRERESDA